MMLTAENFIEHVEKVVAQFEQLRNRVNMTTLFALWGPSIKSGVGRAYANPNGFLLALFITDPIDGVKQACQCFWMQAPGHRRDGESLKLFKQFEKDAKDLGCQRILSGSSFFSDMPKMRRLYSRMGYKPFSENFFKTL